MTRRRSTSPRRAIGPSKRRRPQRPIGRPGTIAVSGDSAGASVQTDEPLLGRQASNSPRRDSAQISVGRRHGTRQPIGKLRTIEETAGTLNVSSRTVRRLINSGTLTAHRFRRSDASPDADITLMLCRVAGSMNEDSLMLSYFCHFMSKMISIRMIMLDTTSDSDVIVFPMSAWVTLCPAPRTASVHSGKSEREDEHV